MHGQRQRHLVRVGLGRLGDGLEDLVFLVGKLEVVGLGRLVPRRGDRIEIPLASGALHGDRLV
ncbi:MAG TPA: hypothetical protein VK601_26105, partial [Kofleriaceae bacterium]|nr:hypothetical protein [Kofleriaceae bacterium]